MKSRTEQCGKKRKSCFLQQIHNCGKKQKFLFPAKIQFWKKTCFFHFRNVAEKNVNPVFFFRGKKRYT